jgi:hypothetical protein
MMNLRYRMAQLAMQGRMLVLQVSFTGGLEVYEGLPPDLPHELRDEHVFFAAMAALRLLAPQYLIYGRGLRDPTFRLMNSADEIEIVTKRGGIPQQTMVKPIVASAWRARNPFDATDDTVGIVFTNFTESDTRFEFDIKPADLELPAGNYKMQETSYRGSTGTCFTHDRSRSVRHRGRLPVRVRVRAVARNRAVAGTVAHVPFQARHPVTR